MTPVYVLELYTNLQTWKISVTPVDVLKLYLFTNMEDLSYTGICTEVIVIHKQGRPQWHQYMYWSYAYLQTWNTSVTPVYVLKLYLSTNMEDLSDTGILICKQELL
jgi:hypothetical protein